MRILRFAAKLGNVRRIALAYETRRRAGLLLRPAAISSAQRSFAGRVRKGFMRIRTYGFLANRHRRAKLALCRRLINAAEAHAASESHVDVELSVALGDMDRDGDLPSCNPTCS